MKFSKFKKLYLFITITMFLISLNLNPANADSEPTTDVPCTGVGSSGTFTIDDTTHEVTESNACVGEVIIPDGVLAIREMAFLNRTRITKVVISDTVLEIRDSAFLGATGITTLTIGNNVTTIRDRAFNGAINLTSLVIPDSVITIGGTAFSGAPLISLILGNHLMTIGKSAFGSSLLNSLVIPDSVVTIGMYAFRDSPLNSLLIGNQLTTIGNNAFASSVFTSVTFPASLTTIGNYVFASNNSLFNVNFLGNAPETVDEFAFDGAASDAKANIAYNATGFPANGSTWKGLIVSYGNPPADNSGSPAASAIIPIVVKTPDAVFNLKNHKNLSKAAMKTKLRKNKSFKRNPKDFYKYSIFSTSKKTCKIKGNYVKALKKTGTCNLYAKRKTSKGAKYKYWVQINYIK